MSYLRYVEQELAIAKGDVPGHKGVNKFGRTENADSAVPTDVWSAPAQPIWLAPTAPRIHAIASTDAETNGATEVQVYGLVDWDTPESSELVAVGANTAASYVIIHRMKVTAYGSAGPNIGIITATAATDGTITARIEAGIGQTEMAIYGIPSTQSAYMDHFYVTLERDSPVGATAETTILWTQLVETYPAIFTRKASDVIATDHGGHTHEYHPPKTFNGPGIIKLQLVSDANDTHADGGFDLVVVDN